MIRKHGRSLDDEALKTLIVEVAAVVNLKVLLQRKVALSAIYHKRVLVRMDKGISGNITIECEVERYIQKFSDWVCRLVTIRSSKRNQTSGKLSRVLN